MPYRVPAGMYQMSAKSEKQDTLRKYPASRLKPALPDWLVLSQGVSWSCRLRVEHERCFYAALVLLLVIRVAHLGHGTTGAIEENLDLHALIGPNRLRVIVEIAQVRAVADGEGEAHSADGEVKHVIAADGAGSHALIRHGVCVGQITAIRDTQFLCRKCTIAVRCSFHLEHLPAARRGTVHIGKVCLRVDDGG